MMNVAVHILSRRMRCDVFESTYRFLHNALNTLNKYSSFIFCSMDSKRIHNEYEKSGACMDRRQCTILCHLGRVFGINPASRDGRFLKKVQGKLKHPTDCCSSQQRDQANYGRCKYISFCEQYCIWRNGKKRSSRPRQSVKTLIPGPPIE